MTYFMDGPILATKDPILGKPQFSNSFVYSCEIVTSVSIRLYDKIMYIYFPILLNILWVFYFLWWFLVVYWFSAFCGLMQSFQTHSQLPLSSCTLPHNLQPGVQDILGDGIYF